MRARHSSLASGSAYGDAARSSAYNEKFESVGHGCSGYPMPIICSDLFPKREVCSLVPGGITMLA